MSPFFNFLKMFMKCLQISPKFLCFVYHPSYKLSLKVEDKPDKGCQAIFVITRGDIDHGNSME